MLTTARETCCCWGFLMLTGLDGGASATEEAEAAL
jgi:hypothetical protein